MTRRLFNRIAKSLSGDYAIAATANERKIIRNVAYSLADIFAQEDSAFDRERFYQVIGLSEPFKDGTLNYRKG